ncbi:MAG: hypothetical protein QXN36_02630 [Candidatus Bathyarchaeia archaeon]
MYFDIVMPLTLFLVTIAAMLLEKKIEGKFKGIFEEKQFSTWNAIVLVVAMSITISLIVFVPQMAIMTMFLFAYSMVLFIFSYLFSNLPKAKAQLFFKAFLIISFAIAMISILTSGANSMVAYGALAFFGLSSFALVALLYEEHRISTEERWYLAVLPPASFICLYVFFSRTPIWFPYLLDMYGIVFAVLITLYLGTLFTWKTTLIFATLLTVMDIILVLFTGAMVSAARHVSVLRLPVLVSLPTLPAITTEWGIIYMSLGLGDFFFAGLLGIQTMKKFDKKFAILSVAAMCISFFIFETILLNYELKAFPGTLMIICGWLPLVILKVIWKTLKH